MHRLLKQAGNGIVESLGTERARRLSRRDFLRATGMAGGGKNKANSRAAGLPGGHDSMG